MSLKPTFYRQLSQSECGPTALQIVISCFGGNVSTDELTERISCTSEGWSVGAFCEVALLHGVHTTVRQEDLASIRQTDMPMVLLVGGHYFVLYKVTRNKVYIADPSHGRRVLTMSDFIQKYGPANAVMITCSSVYRRDPSNTNVRWGSLYSFNYLRSYFKACHADIAKLLSVVLVVGIAQAILPFISRAIIDGGLHSLSLSFIKLMAIGSAVLMLSSVFGTMCQAYVSSYMTYRIKTTMLIEYFEKIFRMVVERIYFRYNVGDIMQRLHDSERIQTYLANVFFTSINSLLLLLIYLAVLFYFDPTLFWVSFAFSALFLLMKALLLRERKNIDLNLWDVQTKCNRYMIHCHRSLIDIKLFNLSNSISRKWGGMVRQLQSQQLALFRFSQCQDALSNIILQTKDIIITYLACSYVLDGNLTMGSLFAILYLAGMLNGPLNRLVVFMDQTQMAQISIQRMSVFNNQPDEVDASKKDMRVFIPKHRHITLEQVSYRYPDGTLALKAFTMRFLIGQKIGIVGKSGSGKSTLLKILCGIAAPTAGDIYFGTSNAKSLNWEVLRKDEFGVMLQDNSIIEGTIIDNIICSNDYDETRLVHSVEMACIRDEIEKLPMGYKTMIGDGYKNLSSGQRQRLLIARAVYQKSQAYVFDEMANGLSGLMEQRIVEKIDKNRSDALRIYATHRGEPIRNADLILVFDDGRLVALGKHDDLVSKSGYYKSLYDA